MSENANIQYCPTITIDLPAPAGKSTVARQVAQKLSLAHLDAGAMYRAVTWLVLHTRIAPDDEAAVAQLVAQCKIDLDFKQSNASIRINNHDVKEVIHTPEIVKYVATIAAQPAVRQFLVYQQQYGTQRGLVAEGRDMGTDVFPNADLKIFLTASVEERARRRWRDLKNRGLPVPDLVEVERSIRERDLKDTTRVLSPLRQADDAIELITDELTIEEVVQKIIMLYENIAMRDKTST